MSRRGKAWRAAFHRRAVIGQGRAPCGPRCLPAGAAAHLQDQVTASSGWWALRKELGTATFEGSWLALESSEVPLQRLGPGPESAVTPAGPWARPCKASGAPAWAGVGAGYSIAGERPLVDLLERRGWSGLEWLCRGPGPWEDHGCHWLPAKAEVFISPGFNPLGAGEALGVVVRVIWMDGIPLVNCFLIS